MKEAMTYLDKRPPALCALLTVLVLAFPLGVGAQAAGAAVLLALTLVLPLPTALCMYVFMFFMDEVTVIAALGGSAARVMQVALLLRFLHFAFGKWRAQGAGALRLLRKSDIALTAFALFAVVMGLIDHGVSGETASFAVNVGLFVLMRPVVREAGADKTLAGMLRFYVLGALAAVLVGVLQGRFVAMLLGDMTQSYARFKGTSEPNFMAAYLGAAVHIHLSLTRGKSRLIDALVTGVLGAGILLTYSMTGMVCFSIATIVLLFVHRDALRPLLARIGLALPVAAVCFALVSGYVMLRGVDSFDKGMIYENIHEDILYVTQEDYEQMRQGADFHDVAQKASDVTPEDVQQQVVESQQQALENQAQSGALLIRVRDALARLSEGDLDALTSGRYGLLRMKLSDYALLPAWQKVLGTGPDAVLTFQATANQLNYCHNSYADMLYSFGAVGLALIACYLILIQRRRLFCGERMGGEAARALFMGRTALMISAFTLSMHISRTMLFFMLG